MRIAVDGRCLMDRTYSGVSWYAYNMVRALLAIDHENEYVIFGNSSRGAKLPDFQAPNVSYKPFKYPNKLLNSAMALFGRPKLDVMVGGADIFWAPNLNFISLSAKSKLVLTVHDLSFLVFPEFFPARMRLWHQAINVPKLLGRADMIIADSKSTKADLENIFKIGDNKVRTVYPGISPDFKKLESYDGRLAQTKTKYNLPDKFILSLGSLEPRKNLQSLLEAYKGLETDATLVIAGGSGWKNNRIAAVAADDSRVSMIGYVDEADKPALYNLAQCLAYPSHYEGFGLPLAEAMACGCPVISGSNSSQSEVVGTAGILVNPYDVADIREAIRAMLSDSDLRAEFSRRGMMKAQEFSWEKSAQEILEIFNNLK